MVRRSGVPFSGTAPRNAQGQPHAPATFADHADAKNHNRKEAQERGARCQTEQTLETPPQLGDSEASLADGIDFPAG